MRQHCTKHVFVQDVSFHLALFDSRRKVDTVILRLIDIFFQQIYIDSTFHPTQQNRPRRNLSQNKKQPLRKTSTTVTNVIVISVTSPRRNANIGHCTVMPVTRVWTPVCGNECARRQRMGL